MLSYRPEIDGLRAIAIVSVVLFHAGGSLFTGGYVGVDIFFVISGFLITSIILKAEREGGFSYREFYARRARRILPALLFMATLVTGVSFAILLPADLVDYGKMLIYTLLFGANFRLTATPAYFDTASQENPLLHMWSLSVEEQFYLLWPALLVAMLAFLAPKRLKLAVLLLALVSLLSSAILVETLPKSAFYHLPSRGWELLAGAILAMRLLPGVQSRQLAEALSWPGLLLMVAPVFLYDKETAFPGLAAVPPVLGSALIIHAESGVATRVGAFLSLKPIVFIGLISYSLYLWHWPVFAFPSYVLMRETTLTESAGLVALAALIATLSWRFVEKPFRKGSVQSTAISLGLRRLPASAYAALALTAILTAFGFYINALRPFAGEAAAASRAGAMIEGCLDEIRVKKGPVECALGLGARSPIPEVVLWGDSHAMAYAPAVSRLFERGMAYLLLDCAPLLGADAVTKDGRRVKKNCISANEYTIAEIEKLRPKLVILAARWTIFQGVPYGRESRVTRYLVTGSAGARTIESSQRVLRYRLVATIDRLRQTGAKIVLIGPTPEMKVPVRRCLTLTRSLGLNDGECRAISRSEVDRRQERTNEILTEAAARTEATIYWPAAQLCDRDRCYAERNEVLYNDGDHLSEYGALSLAPALAAAIKSARGEDVAYRASSLIEATDR